MVIISSDGYIVTNNHVIDNANAIEITLNNKKKYEAELIGADASNDIALLKINADVDLPYTPFANSDNIPYLLLLCGRFAAIYIVGWF